MGNSSAAMEKFRDTVDSLTSVDVSASDTAFWEDLWGGAAGGGAASPQQVFEMVGPQEVRKMREERPGNVEALISQAVYRLCSVLDVPTSEGRAAKVEQQALMVVRVLTRVMPFLLEAYYDPVTDSVDPFLHALFWEVKGEHQQQEDKQPLGNVLVSAIMQLLFHPNICVSPKARPGPKERSGPGSDPEDAASSIKLTKMGYCWVGGLQVVKGLKLPNSRQLERNRAEVLRLLLALLCEPLFVAGDEHSRAPLRFAACVTAASAPFASELFTSLMGVVCSFDPIGWGMPFGASVSSEDPTKLFELSVQVLAVLLDQGRAPLPMILEGAGGGGEDSSSPGTTRVEAPRPGEAGYNIFRDLVLRRITTEADFEFVSKGLTRLLNNVWESQATYIPGSSMTAPCHQELLVISWKLLEENPAFTAFMLRAPQYHVNKVLVPLCYFLTENRKDTSKSGLVHICTFILLKLSGERNFGVALNEPFSAHLPTDLPLFKGTHADLLLVVLHKLVVSGSHRLQGLYHCFLTIICNISPYCKNLSLVASMKLLNLLELFTAPGFLFSSPSNYTFVALLLESFNNLIQYQYVGNAHLVYSIIRRKEVFDRLTHIELDVAQEAARKKHRRNSSSVAFQSVVSTKAGPEGGLETSGGSALTQESQPEEKGEEAGEDDFIPTEEWLHQVLDDLPLGTISRMLEVLAGEVNKLCSGGSADETSVISFLRSSTLVGLLPQPHPIIIRKQVPNKFTALWFTAFLWGCIYCSFQRLPLFDASKIRLFAVSSAT